jgi:hypothetical protein
LSIGSTAAEWTGRVWCPCLCVSGDLSRLGPFLGQLACAWSLCFVGCGGLAVPRRPGRPGSAEGGEFHRHPGSLEVSHSGCCVAPAVGRCCSGLFAGPANKPVRECSLADPLRLVCMRSGPPWPYWPGRTGVALGPGAWLVCGHQQCTALQCTVGVPCMRPPGSRHVRLRPVHE